MPLLTGSDRKTVHKNISELYRHGGRSHRQAVAIALSQAGRGGRRKGRRAKHR